MKVPHNTRTETIGHSVSCSLLPLLLHGLIARASTPIRHRSSYEKPQANHEDSAAYRPLEDALLVPRRSSTHYKTWLCPPITPPRRRRRRERVPRCVRVCATHVQPPAGRAPARGDEAGVQDDAPPLGDRQDPPHQVPKVHYRASRTLTPARRVLDVPAPRAGLPPVCGEH